MDTNEAKCGKCKNGYIESELKRFSENIDLTNPPTSTELSSVYCDCEIGQRQRFFQGKLRQMAFRRESMDRLGER